MNFKDESNNYVRDLNNLTNENLLEWARGRYTGTFFAPNSPFSSSDDPMDELFRTLQLLNSIGTSIYNPLVTRFEETLVKLFIEESNHPFTHPGILYKFLFIFTNCPVKGIARIQLAKHLKSVFSQEKWIKLKVGNRNLHYDTLSLLVRISDNSPTDLPNNQSIDQFLLNIVHKEKIMRISIIALGFFRKNGNEEAFFEVIDVAFSFLQLDQINKLVDEIILYYKTDKFLSTKYFSSWLGYKIVENKYFNKLNIILNDKSLLHFFIDMFERQFRNYSQNLYEENCYLVALLIILSSKSIIPIISPNVVKSFLRNEHFDNTRGKLRELAEKLMMKMAYENNIELKDELLDMINWKGNHEYFKIHISALYCLQTILVGNRDDFYLPVANSINCISGISICIEGDKLAIINDTTSALSKYYTISELLESKCYISRNNIKLSEWWLEILEPCYA